MGWPSKPAGVGRPECSGKPPAHKLLSLLLLQRIPMTPPAEHQTGHDTGLPLDMIIFGGMGDLAMRKLLPALYMAFLHGNLPASTRILSTGRQELGRDAYLAHIDEHSRSFIASANCNERTWAEFRELLVYVRLDVQQAPDFSALAQASRAGAQRVFYLSTAPSLFITICDKLSQAGLVDKNARVVLEKPLGRDLASAVDINEA